MCEACDLRKTYEAEYLDASAILLMIGKIHATVDEHGAMDIRIKLNPSESDWLCEWGAANEDFEDDDPEEDSEYAEEDQPLEESEQLEAAE
jgi:hypothetical protein